jgi:putative superfamily III holin-X
MSTTSNVRYINENDRTTNGRTIKSTMHEVQEEFWTFAETRFAMLQAEMKEKINALKAAVPMMVIGALIAATAWLVFTGALISVIWMAFAGKPYGPFLAFLIVAVVYAIVGFGMLMMAVKGVKEKGLAPTRTIRVLKEDKAWFKHEARTQL